MTVSSITFEGTSRINAATPLFYSKRLNEPAKTPTHSSIPESYQVTLSTEAKAKSMKIQGYSVSLIAVRLGLDAKTVNQYLGITATTDNIFKSTYTPHKTK